MEKLSKIWESEKGFLKNRTTSYSNATPLDTKKFYENIDLSKIPVGEIKEVIEYAPIDYNSFFRAFKFAFKKVNKKEFSHYAYGSETDLTPLHLVKTLTYYFFRDEKFYKSHLLSKFTNPSLDKGFIIAGVKGIGKTDTIKAFYELFSNAEKYEVRNVNNKVVKLSIYNPLCFDFKFGYELIYLIKNDAVTPNMYIRPIYIDDLTREKSVNSFGNVIDYKEFLLRKYDNRSKIFASMNYIESESSEDIYKTFKNKYSNPLDPNKSPLDSRFYEMFNIIEVKGIKDFRR